jgi:hypothetical protein
MNGYMDTLTADQRLVLLRLLEKAPGFRFNSSILRKLMGDKVGYIVPRDKVLTELSWLAEQGLVTLEEGIGCSIATLTSRGLDVATGAASVPGVDRPGPRG